MHYDVYHFLTFLRSDIGNSAGYDIRTFLHVDSVPVKFEIVSEGRIQVVGVMDPATDVPTLARVDMYAEKLLAKANANANADRYRDKAVPSGTSLIWPW